MNAFWRTKNMLVSCSAAWGSDFTSCGGKIPITSRALIFRPHTQNPLCVRSRTSRAGGDVLKWWIEEEIINEAKREGNMFNSLWISPTRWKTSLLTQTFEDVYVFWSPVCSVERRNNSWVRRLLREEDKQRIHLEQRKKKQNERWREKAKDKTFNNVWVDE